MRGRHSLGHGFDLLVHTIDIDKDPPDRCMDNGCAEQFEGLGGCVNLAAPLQISALSTRFEIPSKDSSLFLSKLGSKYHRYWFHSSLLFSSCRFDLAATSLKGLCGTVG